MGSGHSTLDSLEDTIINARDEIVREHSNNNVDQAVFLATHACEQATTIEETLNLHAATRGSDTTVKISKGLVDIANILGTKSKEYVHSVNNLVTILLIHRKLDEASKWNQIVLDESGATLNGGKHLGADLAICLLNATALYGILRQPEDKLWAKSELERLLASPERQNQSFEGYFSNDRLIYRLDNLVQIYQENNSSEQETNTLLIMKDILKTATSGGGSSTSLRQTDNTKSAPAALVPPEHKEEHSTAGGSWVGDVWVGDDGQGWHYNHTTQVWDPCEAPTGPQDWPGSPASQAHSQAWMGSPTSTASSQYWPTSPQGRTGSFDVQGFSGSESAHVLFETIPFCCRGDADLDAMVVDAIKTCFATDPRDAVAAVDEEGNTLLLAACKSRHPSIIHEILDGAVGASSHDSGDFLRTILRKSNHQGWTPLHIACHKTYSSYQVADTLLAYDQYNTLVKLKDNDGCTPLHYAASTMDSGLVALLLVHQASPGLSDHTGCLAVDYCDPDDLESIRLLHNGTGDNLAAAQHHLLHGSDEQVRSLRKCLDASEREMRELQARLDEAMGKTRVGEEALMALKQQVEEERQHRLKAQGKASRVQSQLDSFQGEYESMKKCLHREQSDRDKLTKELERVMEELSGLAGQCAGEKEASESLAKSLAQLYEEKDRIEARLRGSNKEIERLVQDLQEAVSQNRLTEEQRDQASRELMVEQGLRRAGDDALEKMRARLEESQGRLDEMSEQLKRERARAKADVEAKEEEVKLREMEIARQRDLAEEQLRALSAAEANLNSLERSVKKKEEEGKELADELSRIRGELDDLSKSAGAKSAKHQAERQRLIDREAEIAKQSKEHQEQALEMRKKLENAAHALTRAQEKVAMLESKLNEETKIKENMKAQVTDMQTQLMDATAESTGLRNQLDSEKASRDKVKGELAQVKHQVLALQKRQQEEKHLSEAQAKELADKIAKLVAQEEDLELELQRVEEESEELKKKLATADRKHVYLEQEIQSMQDRLRTEQERTLKANADMRKLKAALQHSEEDKEKMIQNAELIRKQEKAKADAIATEKNNLLSELNQERRRRERVLKDLESATWEQRTLMKDRERLEKDKTEAQKRAHLTLEEKVKAEEEVYKLQRQLEKEREARLQHEEEIENLRASPKVDMELTEKLQQRLRQEQTQREEALRELAEARRSMGEEREKKAKMMEEELEALRRKLEEEARERERERRELDEVKASIATLEKVSQEKTGQSEEQKKLAAELQARENELQQKLESMEEHIKSVQEEKESLYKEFAEEQALRKKYYNEIEDLKGKIRVFCRVRPISESENEKKCKQVVSVIDPTHVSISVPGKLDRPGKELEFAFDSCFGPETTQEEVFEDAKRLVQTAVDGYNVCIFAYGQTGSGKTYTLTGPDQFTKDSKQVKESHEAEPHEGITTRSIREIFRLLDKEANRFDFEASLYVIELYKNEMIDLLWKPTQEELDNNETAQQVQPPALSVHLDKEGVVYVENITMRPIHNIRDATELLKEASDRRHVTETKMNSASSRSHLIQSMVIKATAKGTGVVTRGKLTVVDLAGSERASKTGAKGDTLKEAQAINKSLLALGDVIQALTTESKHVPYRNHPLTQLMADSLGGNAKTLMFVNISPVDFNVGESKESLRWATRVKNVTNASHKSVETEQVRKLKAQLAKLKGSVMATKFT